jgi:hypothetical protein
MDLPACKSHTFETMYDGLLPGSVGAGDFVYRSGRGYKGVTVF